MKKITCLRLFNNYRMLVDLLGWSAYCVYRDTDPLQIYYDDVECTFSVRGCWEVDCLSIKQLKQGLLSFAESEVV